VLLIVIVAMVNPVCNVAPARQVIVSQWRSASSFLEASPG